MAARLVLLCFLATLVSATVGQTNITAEPGENITLPCRTKNNQPAVVVEWRRNDLGEKEHVVLYRDDRFELGGQHSLYQNRVDLKDREMKDGDVSLILKNVTTNDTGTYECRVYQRGNKRRKRSNIKGDPICIISLDVAPRPPSGDKGGLQEDGAKEDGANKGGGNSVGLIAGIIVGVIVVLIVGVIVVLIVRVYVSRNCRQSFKEQNPPAIETERDPINVEKLPIS